jgi:hypothetical protein
MNRKLINNHPQALVAFFLSSIFFSVFLLFQHIASSLLPRAESFDLVYLPAGITFVSILVCGIWGALGIIFVLVPTYIYKFPEVSSLLIILMVSFSLLLQLTVIKLCLFFAGIDQHLKKLKHLQLLGLVVVFSLSHSLSHHLNLAVIGRYPFGWSESMIALSTFLGVSFTLLILWIFSKLYDRANRSHFY